MSQFTQRSRLVPYWIADTRLLKSKAHGAAEESFFTSLPLKDLALQFKHRISGRKYLPGSQGGGFPDYLAGARQDLPYALRAQSADHVTVEKWAQLCREVLDKALPLYSAVLFRNLPLFGANDFARFTSGLGYTPSSYEGGTGNRYLAEGETDIYWSTSDPSDYNIELHNEMACSPVHPKKVNIYPIRPLVPYTITERCSNYRILPLSFCGNIV